jgi:hypothetical protein
LERRPLRHQQGRLHIRRHRHVGQLELVAQRDRRVVESVLPVEVRGRSDRPDGLHAVGQDGGAVSLDLLPQRRALSLGRRHRDTEGAGTAELLADAVAF